MDKFNAFLDKWDLRNGGYENLSRMEQEKIEIVMNCNKYFSNSSYGVSELPDGYELGGTLTNEQIEYAISVEEGAEYFIVTVNDKINDVDWNNVDYNLLAKLFYIGKIYE